MQITLKQDPKLPYVDLVWSTTAMTAFLDSHVVPSIWPDQELESVRRERVAWKPGQRCEAEYHLEFRDGDGSQSGRILLTFAAEDRELAEIYDEQYGGNDQDEIKSSRQALLLPDHGCLIEVFPSDWRLTSLARAMSPDEMRPILTAALGDGAEPNEWHCEVSELRYRPHSRCLLHYRLRGEGLDHQREAIGKVYGKSTDVARAFANNCGLHAAASDEGLTIPRPLAFANSLNLVLMERMHGASIEELLSGDAEDEQVVRKAAAALATLHGLPFNGRQADSIASKLERFRLRVARLRLVAPELASRIDATLDRIERLDLGDDKAATCLIHSDAKPTNFMMNGAGVSIVDMDLIRVGDPAIDVGAFLAHFRKHDGQYGNGTLGRLSEPFMDEYQSRNPVEGLVRRARALEGMALVRMAIKRFLRSPTDYAKKGNSARSVRMLEEAERCLERL